MSGCKVEFWKPRVEMLSLHLTAGWLDKKFNFPTTTYRNSKWAGDANRFGLEWV